MSPLDRAEKKFEKQEDKPEVEVIPKAPRPKSQMKSKEKFSAWGTRLPNVKWSGSDNESSAEEMEDDSKGDDGRDEDMGNLFNDLGAADSSASPADILFPNGRLPFIAKNDKKAAAPSGGGNSKVKELMAYLEAVKKQGEQRAQQINDAANERAAALEAAMEQSSEQMANLYTQLADMQTAINNNNDAADARMRAMEAMNKQQQKSNADQFSKILRLLTRDKKDDGSGDDAETATSQWRGKSRRNPKRSSSETPHDLNNNHRHPRSRTPGGARHSD
jgi:cell division septum initiation protein DivIVA